MAVYRAQIGFPTDSALPRDVMTINPHYNSDDAVGLANALKANLIANANVANIYPFTIKIYDAKKAPPSFPLATASNGTVPTLTNVPRELALCLSYYATFNRPRYRGRMYIPAAIVGAVNPGVRPTSAVMTKVATFATTLGKSLPSGTFWTVYSRVTKTDAQVNNWWVDDEWDIVRSRGTRPTTRQVGVLP